MCPGIHNPDGFDLSALGRDGQEGRRRRGRGCDKLGIDEVVDVTMCIRCGVAGLWTSDTCVNARRRHTRVRILLAAATQRRLTIDPQPFGFTLIELVGVMVILVILSALTVPSFVRAEKDARLRASARRVLTTLSLARSTAVIEKCRTRLEVDTEGGVFGMTVERQLPNGETSFMTDVSSMGRPQALGRGIGIEVLEPRTTCEEGVYCITFHDDGRADKAEILLLDNENRSVGIIVEPFTGRATLSDASTPLQTEGRR